MAPALPGTSAFLPAPRRLGVGLLLCLAALLHACAAEGLAGDAPAWNVRDHLPRAEIIVQGHRGVGELAEENTVEAFELAWRMGIYPECDLRMTRDGVIVPFHDDNFARVVQGASAALKKKGVKDLTYAELAQLDVGSWKGEAFRGRHVVPMTRIFELMRGRPERHLYMDVKNVAFPQLAAEVRQYGIERQVVLASKNVADLRAWKELVPESATLLWMHGNEADLRRAFADLRATRFAGITQLQIHVFPKITADKYAPPIDESGPENPFRLRNAFLAETGRELRAHGVIFQVFPYTNEGGAYAPLLDLGVMSFATDHPDLTLRELDAYYAGRRTAAAR